MSIRGRGLLIGLLIGLPVGAGPVEDFDQIWQTVRDEFFDPDMRGVDWEAARARYRPLVAQAKSPGEAAAHVNAMLSELNTSHTRYFTDEDPAYYFLFELFSEVQGVAEAIERRFPGGKVGYFGWGMFTQELDGETWVRAVVDGGPAAAGGVQRGDRLIDVDGEPWGRGSAVRDRGGQRVRLQVQRTTAADSIVTLDVKPEWIEPLAFYLEAQRASARLIRRREHEIAYVHVWSYAGTQYHELVEEMVTRGDLSGADALVLDIRDGWGGASPTYLNLFNPRIPVFTSVRRDGVANTFDSQWRRPVVLLVNDGSRSGKEILAHAFRRYDYGPVVGSRTAGAVTAGSPRLIGERGLLYLAVADVKIDGVRIEGVGVEPDVPVAQPVPYAAGADPQLERAVQVAVDELADS